jgi:serine/threonine-protein kinase RsbW
LSSVLLEEISFVVPGSLDSCCVIRDRVADIALKLPFSDNDMDDIRLAVGEAASNAVRHGCKCHPESTISVRCWTNLREFCVEVKDCGDGFDPSAVREPDFFELPEGGMGIYYMRQSMDGLSFDFDNGTTVTLKKRFGMVE